MYRGIRTKASSVIIWGAALLALSSLPLSAAYFSAGTDVPCAGVNNQLNQTTSAYVASGFVQCVANTLFIGQGGAAGRADTDGVGVYVEYESGIYGSLAQAWGQIDTTFVINGPGTGPIPISINFELSGFLGGGTNAGQVSYRKIENQATILANLPSNGGTLVYDYYGSVQETFNFALNPGLFLTFSGPLAAPGGYCLGPACGIQSPVFNVYPGQTNSLRLWARASVSSSANATANGIASFLNTFGFDKDQQVFNLPEGYTVTVEGLNVVDNCVVGGSCGENGGGGEVPEPGTYGLVGAGLAAALILRRRR